MKKTYTLFLIILCCSYAHAQLYNPCDAKATRETKALFYSMQRLVGAGAIFGHHDDTGYGVNWKFANDSSDVKAVAGSYPALYGWDLAKIEHDSTKDINKIPFTLQKKRVKEAYQRGGINTFCWHMDNPANGKTAWDTTMRTVADIIPGGKSHDVYVGYLDRAAKYLGDLKGKDGEAIPILFRPFHELTGTWFWWCKNTSTPNEFKTLWQFTIDYLCNKKKLHNLLVVYSVADFDSEAEFLERYPGDNYVDMIGFDNYCRQDIALFKKNLDKRLALLDVIAAKHHKLSCLAETGYLNIPSADWWTTVLLPVLSKYKTSYVLMWRNAGMEQYFAPYPGQLSANDFKKFSGDRHLILQNRLTPLGVYGKKLE
ncbi:glycoside hydrolase family 26 protein [Mucilaginibacter sp. OK098]|uniref:glycoside hydrolase family 26 protein n=1 Tax=Mucilaginibacter sp. OK098 TaxID=1855297 RepID=UPI00091DBEED|nr:glycosyl hydrolase [Mucilaginibacter sp. OK098]SHM42811.1 mannan endo-1,4-beta-mannosidase [Mucilaginibacter sp. OK098]